MCGVLKIQLLSSVLEILIILRLLLWDLLLENLGLYLYLWVLLILIHLSIIVLLHWLIILQLSVFIIFLYKMKMNYKICYYRCYLIKFTRDLYHHRPPRKINPKDLINPRNPGLFIFISPFFCAIVFCYRIEDCFA